ncbi:hypothetical protein [Methylocella sp.]|uniref:hypothetical protein n=1 Tax=Methylocella sp. TaxID=1978226 RepID=UPI0035AF56A8
MIRSQTAPRLAGAALLCCSLAVGAAAQEAGQAAAGSGAAPVAGYLDPKTNVFTPIPLLNAAQAAPDAEAAPTVRSGVLTVLLKLTIDAAVPASATFYGYASANVGDDDFNNAVSAGDAVPRSGDSGRLTLKIPYAVTYTTADEMQIEYSIYSSTGAYLSGTQSIPIPKDGAATTVVVNQRI